MVDVLTHGDIASPEALAAGLDDLQVTEMHRVDVRRLVLDTTVRQGSPDMRYARVLAQVDKQLPPVLVHRESMIVLDGVHRVLAARRRGDSHIDVRYVDGSESDAFVLAVRANTAFGKPLTLAERQRCALRILTTHPHWSDRAIAESCGLSGKTVGAMRTRSTEEISQLNSHKDHTGHGRHGLQHHHDGGNGYRVGRDGKARPIDPDERRDRAAKLLHASPESSLRAVAREVGLSPATVKDVRDRLASAAPGPARPAGTTSEATRVGSRSGLNETTADNALRTADNGEAFLTWLKQHHVGPGEWKMFVDVIPVSRIYVVADEARQCAAEWQRFADAIESRVSSRK